MVLIQTGMYNDAESLMRMKFSPSRPTQINIKEERATSKEAANTPFS